MNEAGAPSAATLQGSCQQKHLLASWALGRLCLSRIHGKLEKSKMEVCQLYLLSFLLYIKESTYILKSGKVNVFHFNI